MSVSEALGKQNLRFKWMCDKLVTSFGLDEKNAPLALKCILDNLTRVQSFCLDLSTPPKLFFFYQERDVNGKKDIFLSSGLEGEKLTGKCVYFIRDAHRPVSLTNASDNTIISGELSPLILQNLQQTLNEVYVPLVKTQADWGQIKLNEDRHEFMEKLEEFDDDLQQKIQNLQGEVTLDTPRDKFATIEQKPASYTKESRNPETLAEFKRIVASWISTINRYIKNDSSNIPLGILRETIVNDNSYAENTKDILLANIDAGPEFEIQYWGKRMLSLISITEQLKTKPNRVVTGVLKARALPLDPSEAKVEPEKQLEEQEQIKTLIDQWREVDLKITDALNEAKDNVRFLENLRKVIETLNEETPEGILESMPSLMNSMKMIHTLSRHYGTSPAGKTSKQQPSALIEEDKAHRLEAVPAEVPSVRMCNLFVRITNQLIKRCREHIYGGSFARQSEASAALWKEPAVQVIAKMKSSIALCNGYHMQFADTKKRLAEMTNGNQFNFDELVIFSKFDRFKLRLEKLIDMFGSIEQFDLLEKKRIDGMEKLIASFKALTTQFAAQCPDLLDDSNTNFERDFVEFTMKNSGLENAIQAFMGDSLNKMKDSIEKQLGLVYKFKSVLKREALKDDLDRKLADIFASYRKDLQRLEKMFEDERKHQFEKVLISRNMTKYAGRIYWARQLQRRISGPMRKFKDTPQLFTPPVDKKKNQPRKGGQKRLFEGSQSGQKES